MTDRTFLGIALADDLARTVIVGEEGRVHAQAERPRPADWRDVSPPAAPPGVPDPTSVGLAVDDPEGSGDRPGAGESGLSSRLRQPAISIGAAVALAEAWRGAARGARHVVALVLSRVVTAGAVVDGRVWQGAHGLAGSVGWLSVNPVDREDYRVSGGLQAEIAAAGIVRRLVWRIKAGDESSVPALAGGDMHRIRVEHVLAGARAGDGVAVSVIRDTVRYAAMAIANLALIVDPEVLVVAGLFEDAADLLLEPVRHECGRRLPPALSRVVQVTPGQLGAMAPAIGAARHAMLNER